MPLRLTFSNVIIKHVDIVIPVGPRLLMDKTNCMHHLMKYSSQSLAALTDRDILITTLSTHKRITPNERKKKAREI